MASNDEAEQTNRRGPPVKGLAALVIVVFLVIVSAWALVTVGPTSQFPPLEFVTLPTSPLSSSGQGVMFASVSAITEKGVAVGVKGYLETISGQPVAGAKVYAHYYLDGDYRTQAVSTSDNGYFEIHFPMNWTGWLPVTLTYFGGDQYQGITVVYSLSGENL
ncbi:MAG: hypothetical protein ABSC50_05540 [Candidatus Bathyarchaeia archaeon]